MKTKHAEVKNKVEELSEKVILRILSKGWRRDLIVKYSILYGGQYLSSDGSQNYLVFQASSSYFTTTKNNWSIAV